MIPPLVLNPQEGDAVLDLCAAPGSKTTQLAELMNNKGTLIANEISTERLKSLVFNVDKMSLVNVGILHGKGELLSRQFENHFDKILVDAPCSALGITQKKGEVSNWWDVRKAEAMSDQQFRLLVSAVKMCKVGGEIVYSTCTLTLEENEFVISKVLKKYPVELVEIELPVKSTPGFSTYGIEDLGDDLKKCHRILPWEINSEGFFVAKLIKRDHTEPAERSFRQESGNPCLRQKYELIKSSSGKIKNYLDGLSNYYGIQRSVFDYYKFLIKNNDIHFVDADWHSEYLESFNRIGTRLGTIDKRGILQLNPLAAQVIGEAVTQNLVEIDNIANLDVYFSGGIIRRVFEIGGQRVVKYGDYILGTAVASKEGLKSQFPRAFRTQEIILPVEKQKNS
jgi:16S rRNA (cytosine1407-C5)-methyltransferase